MPHAGLRLFMWAGSKTRNSSQGSAPVIYKGMEHPTPAMIDAYCMGAITDATIRQIEEHLADCPECSLVVAGTSGR